jgi:membrane-bound lytic murein transglycosylase D
MRRRVSALLVLCALLVPTAVRAQDLPPAADAAPSTAAAPAADPLVVGDESEELRALRLAELELFGPAANRPQTLANGEMPLALTSDVPDAPAESATGGRDLSYLQGLALPDLPVRWDSRVVDYLRFFKEDARGHALMSGWLRRVPRHERAVREVLRTAGVPEDLFYVAMVESGLDPTARSGAGAAGMWQFVQGTGQEYGLTRDHWVDLRMSPEAATGAAARYLGDLHRRFGSWELALAAYNMGYGALLRAIRKYNTNDFWTLASVEAGLPFETTLYVAKIMACAVVGRNPARFGFDDLAREAEAPLTGIEVPGGMTLTVLARAADLMPADLARMNPELRRGRTPPGAASFRLRVPADHADAFARQLGRARARQPQEKVYVVRFGETLDDIAARFRTTSSALTRANELDGVSVRAGFTLMVPSVEPREPAASEPPVVSVPDQRFRYADRRRVFYRTVDGDSAGEVARFFGVTMDELRRWNGVDPAAVLQRGMFLQLFVPASRDLTRAVVLAENDVRVLVVGSDEFFDYHEGQRGRVRIRYRVREGDTLATVARRFDLSPGSVARINRFDRATTLRVDQEIIVYAAPEAPAAAPPAVAAPAVVTAQTDATPLPAPAAPSDAALVAPLAAPAGLPDAPPALPAAPPASDPAPVVAPPSAAPSDPVVPPAPAVDVAPSAPAVPVAPAGAADAAPPSEVAPNPQ